MVTVSVVVLTMGGRPTELDTAISSARRQADVGVEIVLVVNGGDPDRSLADVVVEPDENLGIPAGRNAGAAAATGELLCFLDDDGELLGDRVFAHAATAMADRAALGVIALRIVDPEGGTARRHHPGLWGRRTESSDVTSFPGGGCIIRRTAFDDAGGLCGAFFYGLEETDLAWRLLDRGWSIRYDADLRMGHPRTDPLQHADFHRRTARNRVWLAHRNLPLPLAALYVLDWLIISGARDITRPGALRAIIAGTVDGLRRRVGPRRPMSLATVARLTRLGRPPMI